MKLLPSVIAHRGASGDAPENTLAAVARAADDGANAVEIDVNASVDHVPFVHHDDRLERCTTGRGLLHENPADRLDTVRASAGMAAYAEEPLPRLERMIPLLEARSLALNLEIKPPAGLAIEITDAICTVIERHWPAGLTLVFSSFEEAALVRARERLPDVPRALLVGAIPDQAGARLAASGSVNLHCSARGFDAARSKALADDGHHVYCYTVNDSDEAIRLLDAGAAGVFTDYPGRLITALAAAQGNSPPPT